MDKTRLVVFIGVLTATVVVVVGDDGAGDDDDLFDVGFFELTIAAGDGDDDGDGDDGPFPGV